MKNIDFLGNIDLLYISSGSLNNEALSKLCELFIDYRLFFVKILEHQLSPTTFLVWDSILKKRLITTT